MKKSAALSKAQIHRTLYELAPPRPAPGQRGRGRPRKRGAPLPKLAQIATNPATQWQNTTVRRYGKTEQVMVHALTCLWYQAFCQQPIQVVLIQDTSKPQGYELAVVSTDLQAAPSTLIERYSDRWPIEVAYEEGKELFGIGQARNRTENSIHRTVPFQFLAMSITIIWYALHGHHPDDLPSSADAPPGTSPRPPPHSPTCSPSSAA